MEQAARRIAEVLAAGAPRGWTRAILAGSASPGSTSLSGSYTAPGAPRWGFATPSPFQELNALAAALRADRGWDSVSVEVECRPSGEYRVVATAATITSLRGRDGGFITVLDDDYRLPQPGSAQAGSTAAAAGDPQVAAALFRRYLALRAEVLGRPVHLPAPATAAALDDTERRMGCALPDDLRALYLLANGDADDVGTQYLIADNAWLGVESLAAVHPRLREPALSTWELAWKAVILDADPHDTVRRCGGHPGWLPFASGEDGNFLAVDMAPARGGRPGQVIRIGRDYHDGPAYVAESVTALLSHHVAALEAGDYVLSRGYADDDEEDAEDEDDGTDEVHLDLPRPDPVPVTREIIGAIPDEVPPTLQALHINDAPDAVDLTPLTAAPRLRRLHLNRSATADLTPLRTLPIESLRVTLDGTDLTPLAGHGHLAALDLTTTAPVDIAPLRDIPTLRCLDLSGAEVTDLTVLAGLPALRYLSLTAQQWATLLDAVKALPQLAAARLADPEATADEAVTWSARLGSAHDDAFRTTGTLT